MFSKENEITSPVVAFLDDLKGLRGGWSQPANAKLAGQHRNLKDTRDLIFETNLEICLLGHWKAQKRIIVRIIYTWSQ